MTYPHPALASILPIAAGAERDAWEAIAGNTTLRAMLSPDPADPIAVDDIAGMEEKLLLGHVTQDTVCPYIAIAIENRSPTYCVSQDPQVLEQSLASVSETIKVFCASRRYLEARDLGLLVLKTLEPISTPHVQRWRQIGYEYSRIMLEDASDDMGHMVELTFEAMLVDE